MTSDAVLLFWTYFTLFSCVSIVDFEQVNVSWELWDVIWHECGVAETSMHGLNMTTLIIAIRLTKIP